jgi:uncharacterized protein (TIGR03435 family)
MSGRFIRVGCWLICIVILVGTDVASKTIAQSVPANPPVGQELSKVAHVSLIREPAGQNAGWANRDQVTTDGVTKLTLSCGGRTLADTIEYVTGVPRSLIFGSSSLPRGTYAVKITAAAEKQLQPMFLATLEQAFQVRVSLQNEKVKALVLSRASNWDKDGFKAIEQDTGVQTASGDGTNFSFDGSDMNWLAGQLAQKAGKPVLNETELKGKFQGTLPIDGKPSLSRLQKALRQRGLLLQPATRSVQIVRIDTSSKK